MPPTLTEIPVEVLSEILALLAQRDYYVLSLVCRDLRLLAEPFLYREIAWLWKSRRSPPPIVCFLRSILRRPQLADHVQILNLDGGPRFKPPYFKRLIEYPKIPTEAGELKEAILCIKNMNLLYGDLWISKIEQGVMDGFVALLLSRLHNLRTLHLSRNFTKGSCLTGRMLRSALCDPRQHDLPSFSQLEIVTAVCVDIDINVRWHRYRRIDASNAEDILPLWYLPAVRQITTWIENPMIFEWPGSKEPDPSMLTTLDLKWIREGNLGQILSVTRSLRKLRWDWFYHEEIRDKFVTKTIDLDQIGDDLYHVHATLEELTITSRDEFQTNPWFRPALTIKGSLQRLTHFESLASLEIPVPFLVASFSPSTSLRLGDIVPRNIKALTFLDDLVNNDQYEWHDIHLMSLIDEWLGIWKQVTPRLRGIGLHLEFTDDEWGPTMRDTLRARCDEEGLQIDITKLRIDPQHIQ